MYVAGRRECVHTAQAPAVLPAGPAYEGQTPRGCIPLPGRYSTQRQVRSLKVSHTLTWALLNSKTGTLIEGFTYPYLGATQLKTGTLIEGFTYPYLGATQLKDRYAH